MTICDSLDHMRAHHSVLQEIDDVTWAGFKKYFVKNTDIWRLFVKFAIYAKGKGKTKYSAKAIIERARWECELEGGSGDYKINNNWTSCMARLLVAKSPDFKDFFEFRELEGVHSKQEAA